MKKLYLIGKSLKHSISPLIHNKILSYFGIDAVYSNVELQDFEKLKEFVEIVKKDEDVVGFNITIPYKEDILNFCDEVSEDVKIIQAANTVKKENGRLKAYNTDWIGFKKSLEELGIDISDRKILILGAGGAAKACIYGLYKMGVKEIFVSNRTYEKAQNLRDFFRKFVEIHLIDWLKRESYKYDIIINTTPIGMFPEIGKSPFDIKEYKFDLLLAYDTIYNPLLTEFLKEAKTKNINISNGLKMLIYQAIEAEKIWWNTAKEIEQSHQKELERLSQEFLKDS